MIIQKIYAWTLVLQPMTFFVLMHQGITGLGASLSRLLQVIVLFLLISSIVLGKRTYRFPSPRDFRYFLLICFFFLAVSAGIYGILMGVYSADEQALSSGSISFASYFNSPYVRPFFEYCILFYNIVYFVVFPTILLKKKEDLKYFFKVFFCMFNLSLVVGIIDLIVVSQCDFTILGKSLYEWYAEGPRNIGFRFHGYFGEPRDAFVILGLGAALYGIRSTILNCSENKFYYILILLCALFTQSASGLVGIVILTAFYVAIYIHQIKYLNKVIAIIILFGITMYMGTVFSPRLIMMFEGLCQLKQNYVTGSNLNPILVLQQNNIYPIFWFLDNLFKMNILPVLFGTGLGSASHINQAYHGINELSNPHSNIIRLLVETGVIGIIVYIGAFYYPIKRAMADLSFMKRKKMIFFSLLVLSLSLSHRSVANLIFLGVFFATMNVFRSSFE
jgi:hypothetical protein